MIQTSIHKIDHNYYKYNNKLKQEANFNLDAHGFLVGFKLTSCKIKDHNTADLM